MLTIIIRTAVMYVFITLAIRLMGKRQIGDMQPNELVITLLISEIAAIPLQDTDQPILSGIVAIFMLVILEIIISVIAMKSFSVRKLMSGKSVVIIKNGLVDEAAMKQVRMTVLDLIELLRQSNVFNISQVAYAVLEVNGSLSVLLKSEFSPATPSDLKIKCEKETLCLPVICDGKIVDESLKALQTDKTAILEALQTEDKRPSDVFLMTMDRNGQFEIIGKRGRL